MDALFYEGGRWSMDGLLQDIGVAVRSLMRRPGFTLVTLTACYLSANCASRVDPIAALSSE